jgi:hypothetical protein
MDANLERLFGHFERMIGMSKDNFLLSIPFWEFRSFKKDEHFNKAGSVCWQAGFVLSGVFRSYIVSPKTGEEKNIFFWQLL